MKKFYVIKTVVFGLFFVLSLFSFDMEAQAKSWGQTPELKTEAIHERNFEEYRNDASSDRNLIDDGMDSDLNAKRKEWSTSGENIERVPVSSQSTSIDEDKETKESSEKRRDSKKSWSYFGQAKQFFLDLQKRNDHARFWIRDRLVKQITDVSEEWTRALQDKTLLGMRESWKAAFDPAENHLHLDKRVNEKKDDINHQREDRWFIFDAKNHEESKEKESKKKKVKQEQTRNGKDLETRNKVYVNALLRVRMELVYFACAKEREWIVRRETLF